MLSAIVRFFRVTIRASGLEGSFRIGETEPRSQLYGFYVGLGVGCFGRESEVLFMVLGCSLAQSPPFGVWVIAVLTSMFGFPLVSLAFKPE